VRPLKKTLKSGYEIYSVFLKGGPSDGTHSRVSNLNLGEDVADRETYKAGKYRFAKEIDEHGCLIYQFVPHPADFHTNREVFMAEATSGDRPTPEDFNEWLASLPDDG
jgi:hypothetical protein